MDFVITTLFQTFFYYSIKLNKLTLSHTETVTNTHTHTNKFIVWLLIKGNVIFVLYYLDALLLTISHSSLILTKLLNF